MFGIITKMFIVLLGSIVNASNQTKCISLSIQKCEIQSTLINLYRNEYSQELHYHPFTVKLDECVGGCNTLNDLYNKVYIPNKTGDLNIYVFNMITGKNEPKLLAKDISCQRKARFDQKNVIQINSGTMINVDVSVINILYVKKNYIFNPATCSCENGKYLKSIMDDSAITCDEIIDTEAKSNDEET